jgi:hypothetical protein
MSSTPSQWYKDQFLISTSQSLLQPDVINKAFAADYMYWAKAMSEDSLKRILSNSLCFGVYALPESSSEIAGQSLSPLSSIPKINTIQVVHRRLKSVLVESSQTSRPLRTSQMFSSSRNIEDVVLESG